MSSGRIKHPLSKRAATELINGLASDDRTEIGYTTHATERMEQRSISPFWVADVLTRGQVVDVQKDLRNGREVYKYKVQFVDKYGRTDVLTAIPWRSRLTIITVFTDDPDE